jgi:hypothetical protein
MKQLKNSYIFDNDMNYNYFEYYPGQNTTEPSTYSVTVAMTTGVLDRGLDCGSSSVNFNMGDDA